MASSMKMKKRDTGWMSVELCSTFCITHFVRDREAFQGIYVVSGVDVVRVFRIQ